MCDKSNDDLLPLQANIICLLFFFAVILISTSGLFSIAGSQRLLRKVKTTLVLTSFVSRRRGSGNNAHGPSLIVFVRISSEKSGFSISLSFADENLHVVLLFKSIAVPVFRVRSFSAVIPIWRCLFS